MISKHEYSLILLTVQCLPSLNILALLFEIGFPRIHSVAGDWRSLVLVAETEGGNPKNRTKLISQADSWVFIRILDCLIIPEATYNACISITFFSNSSFGISDLLLTLAL